MRFLGGVGAAMILTAFLSTACESVALDPNRSPVTISRTAGPTDADAKYRIEQQLHKGDGISVTLENNVGLRSDYDLPAGDALWIDSQNSRDDVALQVRDKWLDPDAADAMTAKANRDFPPTKDRSKTVIALIHSIHDWQAAHPRPAPPPVPALQPAPAHPATVTVTPAPAKPAPPPPPYNAWGPIRWALGAIAWITMIGAVGSWLDRKLVENHGFEPDCGYVFAILWPLVLPFLIGETLGNWMQHAPQRRATKKTNADVTKLQAEQNLVAEQNKSKQLDIDLARAQTEYVRAEGVRVDPR